jgi:hypothetical protein
MNIEERIAQFQKDFEIKYLAPDGRGSEDHIKQLIRDVLEEVTPKPLTAVQPTERQAGWEAAMSLMEAKIKELEL